ncbi:MAG: DUF2141 domain-containing protein [Proteobacteria bacterium]|nr:DUF2141 domain-containing protein [Pseudomonadota bacterium]
MSRFGTRLAATLALPLGAALLSLGAITGASAADLTVRISATSRASNDGAPQGQINAALYGDAASWPKDGQRLQGERVNLGTGPATVVFRGLAPGRYAVSAFLDEDGDGKLGTNMAGIPREPYGFSRDARGRFGPPPFDDAAVDVQGDTAIEMTLK